MNAKSYFTDQALTDSSAGFRLLGKLREFAEIVKSDRGGLTLCRYDVKSAKRKIQAKMRDLPDGKTEEYQVFSTE